MPTHDTDYHTDYHNRNTYIINLSPPIERAFSTKKGRGRMDKKEAFLNELSELSKKHGMFIGGCGCCDSPFIYVDKKEESLARIDWNDEKQEYEADSLRPN